MTLLTVSVIVPVRDAADTLADCVDSLLRLSYPDDRREIIVVDNASSDATPRILDRYGDALVSFREARIGPAAARNAGLRRATGDVIAFTDADCIVDPDWLHHLVRPLEDPSVGVVGGRNLAWNPRNRIAAFGERIHDHRKAIEDVFPPYAITMNWASRRSALIDVGEFDPDLLRCSDVDMAFRMTAAGYRLVYAPAAVVRHRNRSTARTLFLEAYAHGVHGVAIERMHAEFIRNQRSIPRGRRLSPAPRRRAPSDWIWGSLFRVGKLVGRTRGRVLDGGPRVSVQTTTNPVRVAYFLWQYPTLSETFIQREIAALAEAGAPVLVVAEGPGQLDAADDSVRALCSDTIYISPLRVGRLARQFGRLLATRPRSALRALAKVRRTRHAASKSVRSDLVVYSKTITLAVVLREQRITHVHAPWAHGSAFISMVAADVAGITYSVQARATADLYGRKTAHALHEKFAGASFVITNSAYNVRTIRTFLDASEWHRVHRIYNGLPLDTFEPRRVVAKGSGSIRLLSVARLVEEKGLVHLLRACHLLRARGHILSCEIVGPAEPEIGSDHRRELAHLQADLGLLECVKFVGAQPFSRVLEHYRSADIFVLPCVVAESGGRDVTPNALLEAMAMALPVVSTTSAAVPEIVEDGVSGLLVPPGDSAALADAIERLAADPDLRARLGNAARARVETRFDIRKNVLAYVELFENTQRASTGPLRRGLTDQRTG